MKGGASWAWVWEGFKSGLNWCLETLIRMLEVFGVDEALQFVWGLIFHTRNLPTPSARHPRWSHGEHLIPYWEVQGRRGLLHGQAREVDQLVLRTRPLRSGPITTMHIIQAPKDIDLETIVHELTHVVQYERIGRGLHAPGPPRPGHERATTTAT